MCQLRRSLNPKARGAALGFLWLKIHRPEGAKRPRCGALSGLFVFLAGNPGRCPGLLSAAPSGQLGLKTTPLVVQLPFWADRPFRATAANSAAARNPLASAPCTVPTSSPSAVASPAKNRVPCAGARNFAAASSPPAAVKLYAPRLNGSRDQLCVSQPEIPSRSSRFEVPKMRLSELSARSKISFLVQRPSTDAAGPPAHPVTTGALLSDHHTGTPSVRE
jgi:hypothetical protein